MKWPVLIFVGLGILAIVLVFAWHSPSVPLAQSFPGEQKPIVAATIFPLVDIVRRVAGPRIEVRQILPPGASPHTFEPTPTHLRGLIGAQVIFEIGHGADAWASQIASATGVPVFSVDHGIELRRQTDGGDVDPHYWLTISNAATIAKNVAVELSRRFPSEAGDIASRLSIYEAELASVDADIRARLQGLDEHRIVTFHDAWYYFADAYGLEVIGTFEPSAGREPTPQSLADLSRSVWDAGLHTVYAEPSFSQEALEAFAKDSGLDLVVVDPTGATQTSYIDLMRFNASAFAKNR